MSNIATTATAPSTLTPAQVCDLPMDDLLGQVNGTLGTIDLHGPAFAGIDTSKFFGYIVVRPTSVDIYTPADATDEARDVYVRYLITQHLGLPTDLFPDVFEITVFAGPNLDEVQA